MKAKTISLVRWGALAVMICLWLPCYAQYSASVQGTVTDPGGSVVSGATVTLTNTATGITDTTTTNDVGAYHFVNLLPGDYRITVVAAGFAKATAAQHVGAEETAGVNIPLTVGGSTTTVEVKGAEEGMNPDEERLEYTLESKDFEDLPMPDRATLTTLRLTPGVVGTIETTGSTNTNVTIGNAAPDARANGRSATSNTYLLDRIPISSTENTAAVNMVPNPDMLSEIVLQTNTFAVDNGATSSLQIDFTSKSGGNKFHGDGDITYTSKPFEAPPDFGGVAPFHRKYFMGSLGGPIFKDNTFFFGSIERIENVSALGAIAGAMSVTGIGGAEGIGEWAAAEYAHPLPGWNMAGLAWSQIFSYQPTAISNPTVTATADGAYPNGAYNTTIGSGSTTATGNGEGVECNTVTAFNLPCNTVIGEQGEFNQNPTISGQNYNLRFDHNFRQDNDKIYVGYFGTQQTSQYLDPRPAFDSTTPSQTAYFSAGWSHILTPSLTNQFNIGYNRYWSITNGNPNYNVFPIGTLFGWQDSGGGFYGGPQETPGSPPLGQANKEHILALRDYVSWIKGKHSFKFGFQSSIRNYWQNSAINYSRPYGTYFSDILEMLQGEADEYSLYTIGATGASAGKWIGQYYGAQQDQFAGYAQDDWKIRPNLQFTLGVRWDDYGNPSDYGESSSLYSNTFLSTGSSLWTQVSNASARIVSRAFNGAQAWNFLPRAAFTYSPGLDKKLVVRGGIGLYQDSVNLNQITANLPTTTPVRLTLTLHDAAEVDNNFFSTIFGGCPSPAGTIWCVGPWQGVGPVGNQPIGVSGVAGQPGPFAITGTQGNTAPFGIPYPALTVTGISSRGLALGPGGSTYQSNMYGVDPNLKPQSTITWNFGLEQELPNNLVVGATYSGSYSYNQYLQSNSYNNPPASIEAGASPWPAVGTIQLIRNVISSNYNALILTATQRISNLNWQGNFLWSHALGNPGSGDNPSPYNATAAYGTTGLDVPLRVTVSGAYQFSGGNSALAKGWSLGAIFIAQEGTPFTVYSNQDVNGDANKDGENDLPNIVFQPGGNIHYGRYSNAQYKAGIFNECGGGTSSGVTEGNLYSATAYPLCPFQQVTTPNSNTLEGNEPYNAFRNPGYWDVDLNLQKKIELPWIGDQKSHLNLRFEALNAFNHANLNGFGGSQVIASSSTFGAIASAANPRIMQIGARFEF
ncbi:MAG: TonB-dependent receptor [Terracidiphilus sp.]